MSRISRILDRAPCSLSRWRWGGRAMSIFAGAIGMLSTSSSMIFARNGTMLSVLARILALFDQCGKLYSNGPLMSALTSSDAAPPPSPTECVGRWHLFWTRRRRATTSLYRTAGPPIPGIQQGNRYAGHDLPPHEGQGSSHPGERPGSWPHRECLTYLRRKRSSIRGDGYLLRRQSRFNHGEDRSLRASLYAGLAHLAQLLIDTAHAFH